jgi:Holliday junction resolvase RusA-like endonuclease
MKPVHEMSIAEAQEVATRRELNRRMGRPLDAPAMAPGLLVETPETRETRSPRQEVTTLAHPTFAPRPLPIAPAPAPAVAWPLRLTLPWSMLVSDNLKWRAATRGNTATIVLTPAYRDAKRRIRALCLTLMAGRRPLTIPLALEARVWVPDRRRRDVVNYSKALHDALTGTVFLDDAQLHDVRWIRAGVDVDAPRADITITPLASPPLSAAA